MFARKTITASVTTTLALGLALISPAHADPTAPMVSAPAPAPVAPPAPPAAPYSLPWQLRPAAAVNVLRFDSSYAFYQNAAGATGGTLATTILGSYKLTPSFALMARLGVVRNEEPGPMLGGGAAFLNPFLGAVYAGKFGDFRWSSLLGATIPVGTGGDKPAGMDTSAAALRAGILARSAMDNALFAVNYMTGVAGLDLAYVAHKFTFQAEATLLQLFRVRHEDVPGNAESTRTNFTMGFHAGYFLTSFMSLGAEWRYQRWLSTPAAVKMNSAARDTMTVAVGPRFHIKLPNNKFLRPGISYSFAVDKPAVDLDYHIVQVDVPFLF